MLAISVAVAVVTGSTCTISSHFGVRRVLRYDGVVSDEFIQISFAVELRFENFDPLRVAVNSGDSAASGASISASRTALQPDARAAKSYKPAKQSQSADHRRSKRLEKRRLQSASDKRCASASQ